MNLPIRTDVLSSHRVDLHLWLKFWFCAMTFGCHGCLADKHTFVVAEPREWNFDASAPSKRLLFNLYVVHVDERSELRRIVHGTQVRRDVQCMHVQYVGTYQRSGTYRYVADCLQQYLHCTPGERCVPYVRRVRTCNYVNNTQDIQAILQRGRTNGKPDFQY